ncbi:MAG: DUF424 family protein [Candidatus Aenigmatarchaeota archaeon]
MRSKKDTEKNMIFTYKIFRQSVDTLLAISDASITGKKFEDKDMTFDISTDFYGSEKCSKEQALKLMKSSTIINACGKDIVSLMIKECMIPSGNVLEVCGIPHAQVVVIK